MFQSRTNTDKEKKQSSPPTISYIWIGPPSATNEKGIAQHDLVGIKQMYEAQKGLAQYNPLQFFCLKEHEAYYKNELKNCSPQISVYPVEEFLETKKSSSKSTQASDIQEMIKVSLSRKNTRDRVSIKEAMSLFLLEIGGYIFDTNILPNMGKFPLPNLKTVVFPQLCIPPNAEWGTEQFTFSLECWAMYSPGNNNVGLSIFKKFFEKWKLNQIPGPNSTMKQELYLHSKGYYEVQANAIILSILDVMSSDSDINTWNYFNLDAAIADIIELPELGIKKLYYGTHKWNQQSKFDNFDEKKHFDATGDIPSKQRSLDTIVQCIKHNVPNKLHSLLQTIPQIDPNSVDEQNKLPLIFALEQHNLICTRVLLENGANLDCKIASNATPREYIIQNQDQLFQNVFKVNDLYGIQILISSGAKLSRRASVLVNDILETNKKLIEQQTNKPFNNTTIMTLFHMLAAPVLIALQDVIIDYSKHSRAPLLQTAVDAAYSKFIASGFQTFDLKKLIEDAKNIANKAQTLHESHSQVLFRSPLLEDPFTTAIFNAIKLAQEPSQDLKSVNACGLA